MIFHLILKKMVSFLMVIKSQLKLIYSQETAKQLKAVLKEESQTFDVSGLTVKYQSASQIDKAVYQKAYDKANQESKERIIF